MLFRSKGIDECVQTTPRAIPSLGLNKNEQYLQNEISQRDTESLTRNFSNSEEFSKRVNLSKIKEDDIIQEQPQSNIKAPSFLCNKNISSEDLINNLAKLDKSELDNSISISSSIKEIMSENVKNKHKKVFKKTSDLLNQKADEIKYDRYKSEDNNTKLQAIFNERSLYSKRLEESEELLDDPKKSNVPLNNFTQNLDFKHYNPSQTELLEKTHNNMEAKRLIRIVNLRDLKPI